MNEKQAGKHHRQLMNLKWRFILNGLFYILFDKKKNKSFIFKLKVWGWCCGPSWGYCSCGRFLSNSPSGPSLGVQVSTLPLEDTVFLIQTTVVTQTHSYAWTCTLVSPWWGSAGAAAARLPLCADTHWSPCSHSSANNRWRVSAPVMVLYWQCFKSLPVSFTKQSMTVRVFTFFK